MLLTALATVMAECDTCTDPNGKNYCPRFGQHDRPESDLDIASELNGNRFRLPDGTEVRFRTKGRPGSIPPGPFSRDNVRDIVRSPLLCRSGSPLPDPTT